jgi:hypothetical protein
MPELTYCIACSLDNFIAHQMIRMMDFVSIVII